MTGFVTTTRSYSRLDFRGLQEVHIVGHSLADLALLWIGA